MKHTKLVLWLGTSLLMMSLQFDVQAWPVHGKFVQPSGDQLMTGANDPLTTGSGDPLVTQ